MGLFTKKPSTGSRKKRLSLDEILMIGALIIVGLFAFTLLFGEALGFGFEPGPIALFAMVMVVTLVAFAVTKKMLRGHTVSRQDMATLVIIAGLTILALMYLPDLAPEMFEQSILSLKSSLPLP